MKRLLLTLLLAPCSLLLAQSLALDVFDGDDFAQVDVTLGANSLLGFDSAGQPARITAGTGITISGNVITSSGGGGSSTLANLTDVTLTSPANNQLLRYNSATSKWVNWTPDFAPLDSPAFTNTVTLGEISSHTVQNSITVTDNNGGTNTTTALKPGTLEFAYDIAVGTLLLTVDMTPLTEPRSLLWPNESGTLATTAFAANASNLTSGTVADARLSGNVSLLGSSIALGSEVSGILPVANGGTGQTTISAARVAILPSITGNAGKFLRVNGAATDYELATISGGGDAMTSGTLGQFATTTSAQLRGVLSDESGTGEILTTTGSAADLSSFPTLNQNTTGNAATATALQTGREINGVVFDGTANITVAVDALNLLGDTLSSSITTSSLTNVGIITGGGWQASPIADAYISSAATWNAKETALTFSTGLTRSVNTVTVNTSQNIATLSNLTSNGFVKTSGGTGALSVDTSTYLTTTGNGSSLTGLTQSQVSGLTTTDRAQFANTRITSSTLTYAATTNLDCDGDGFQTLSLTGNVTFTTSNRASGRSKTIRIVADGSSRTLTFPAGWTFLGAAAPSSISASKVAILTVTFFGTADSDAIAAYAVQP